MTTMSASVRASLSDLLSRCRSHLDLRTSVVSLVLLAASATLGASVVLSGFRLDSVVPSVVVSAVLFVTAITAVTVGTLTDGQFLTLGSAGMSAVAISAHLVNSDLVTMAIVSTLVVIPALAACTTSKRAVMAITGASVLLILSLSLAALPGSGVAVTVIVAGAAVTAVLVPVSMVTALRDSIDRTSHRLERAAATDPLTGLLNRRGLMDNVDGLIGARADSIAGQSHIGALVIDIDRLKTVNDTLGHSAGDRVLRDVAGAITHTVSTAPSDETLVCRLGGEEFLVLTHRPHLDRLAATVLSRVRATGAVTVSIGSAHGRLTKVAGGADRPDLAAFVDALIHAADDAMFASKTAGRDTITASRPAATEI